MIKKVLKTTLLASLIGASSMLFAQGNSGNNNGNGGNNNGNSGNNNGNGNTTILDTLYIRPEITKEVDAIVQILNGDTIRSNANFSQSDILLVDAWTQGGQHKVSRTLMRWDLVSIPTGSTIQSASLQLFHSTTVGTGNSTEGGSNEAWVEKIDEYWDGSTVTWNTQPNTTTQNRAQLVTDNPLGVRYIQSDAMVDVTAMVQDFVDNPSSNNGIKISLATEQRYRRRTYFSSDYADSTKHPRLIIEYQAPANIHSFCAPAKGKPTGELSPQVGEEYTYRHNYAAHIGEQFTWDITGATMVDSVLVDSTGDFTVTKTDREIDIIWGNFQQATMKATPNAACPQHNSSNGNGGVVPLNIIFCNPILKADSDGDGQFSVNEANGLICANKVWTFSYEGICDSNDDFHWGFKNAATVNGVSVSAGWHGIDIYGTNKIDISFRDDVSVNDRFYINAKPLQSCGFLGFCGKPKVQLKLRVLVSDDSQDQNNPYLLNWPCNSSSIFNFRHYLPSNHQTPISYNWVSTSNVLLYNTTNEYVGILNGTAGTFHVDVQWPLCTETFYYKINTENEMKPTNLTFNTSTICFGDVVRFNWDYLYIPYYTANFEWRLMNNNAIISAGTTNDKFKDVTITNNHADMVMVRAIYQCGTSAWTKLPITVEGGNNFELKATGQPFCSAGTFNGTATNVNLPAGTTFEWVDNNGGTNPPTQVNVSGVITIDGGAVLGYNFDVREFSPNGCPSTFTKNIVIPVNEVPNVPMIEFPQVYCEGGLVPVSISNAQGGIDYTWKVVDFTPWNKPDFQVGLPNALFTQQHGSSVLLPLYNLPKGGYSTDDVTVEVTATGCNNSREISTTFDNTEFLSSNHILCNGGVSQRVANSNTENEFEINVRLVPNPAAHQVTVNLPEGEGNTFIQITDAYGVVKKTVTTTSFSEMINISDLPFGLYNVIVRRGKETAFKHLQISFK